VNLHKIAGMETKSSHPEINILEVLAKIIDHFKANIFLAILLPLAGGLAGFLISRSTPEKVQSNMMVVTNLLTEEQCSFLLTQFETSQPIPNTTPEQLDALIELSHEVIRPYRYFTDDRSVNLQITLTLKDERFFPLFQQSILDFLENSTAATTRKKTMQQLEAKLIEGIDHELASIEQIKTGVSGKDKLNSLNAASLYVETIKLLEKKLQLQNQTSSGKIFTVVEGFKNKMHRKSSMVTSILLGVGAGILLLFFWIAVRYFGNYYRNYQSTQR
jgi:hypothetical protein